MAEVFITFCSTRLAILKWLQILCCTITFVFLIEGHQQWRLYSALFFVDLFLAILTMLTLLAYFLRIQVQIKSIPWLHLEIFFNLLAMIVSLIFTGWLIYDLSKMHNNNFSHHKYAPPRNIGNDGWKHRVLIVIVAQVLSSIFYSLSLYRTKAANRIN